MFHAFFVGPGSLQFFKVGNHGFINGDEWRCSMNVSIRLLVHGLIFIMGLVLIVGGIVTGTNGAWIVGLIVAAVNFRHWQKMNK